MRHLPLLPLLALLAPTSLLLPSAAGADDPTEPRVGMTRAVFERIVEQRHANVISEVDGVVALESDDPGVEFERYQFTSPTEGQPGRLWQIVFAYRMPAPRTRFDAIEHDLVTRMGSPAETVSRGAAHGEPLYERRVWRAGNTSVTLAGCPDGETVDDVARLQMVVVERHLEQVAQAQRKQKPAAKK